MRIMEVRKIAVLGAGLMGHGICQVAAKGGYEVSLRGTELYYDCTEK
jgi:3-hydroxyacyl-CoA dehydrogenase